MATTTPNLGLTKPNPNGDDDAWAPMLNGNADILDTQVKAALDNAAAANANANGRVSKTGDTMTGALAVTPASGTAANIIATSAGAADATIALGAPSGRSSGITLRTGASARWGIVKNAAPETGSNVGSDFVLTAYSDAGGGLANSLTIARANSRVTAPGGITSSGLWATLDNSMAFFDNGAGVRILQFASSWYWSWNGTSGDLSWNMGPTGGYLTLRADGALIWGGANNAWKIGGGPWADISDGRFKQDIEDYTAGLTEIRGLQPRVYSFRPETGRDPSKRYIGAIAQEVEEMMPEMVIPGMTKQGSIEHADAKSLDATALPWALVNAVKELAAKLEAAEARIAALEAAQP